MAAKLDNLGFARVFRHSRSGELMVDTDTLRRSGPFAGADFGADRYDDEDDYEDDDDTDDDGYDDEDDFEGDDFGDDVEGDDIEGDGDIEGDDFGARGRSRRRRLKRRLDRLNRREDRTRRKLRQSRRGKRRGRRQVRWGMTAVAGTTTLVVAGGGSVKMRLQHDFHAEDITFTGSAAGAKVTSIFFGDRVVWSSSDGIDVTVFGSTSFLRGLLKGQFLKGGLDITVNGTLPGPGDFAVTLVGKKPVNDRC